MAEDWTELTANPMKHPKHHTRHSLETRLAAAAVAQDVRNRLMRHAPQSVGARHYLADDWDALARAVARISIPLPADPFRVSSGAASARTPGRISSRVSSENWIVEPHREETHESFQVLAPVAQWIEQRFPKQEQELARDRRESAPTGNVESDSGSDDARGCNSSAPETDRGNVLTTVAALRGKLSAVLAELDAGRLDAAAATLVDSLRALHRP